MVTWHLTMTCLLPNAISGQHCESYDVKRETVHFHPRSVEDDMICSLESQRVIQKLLLFCYKKSLIAGRTVNVISLESQCFPRLRPNKIHRYPRDSH